MSGHSYETYWNAKQAKLQEQYGEAVPQESDIFKGKILWVNGYTRPPLSVLKPLIVANGGVLLLNYDATRVTDIIAEHSTVPQHISKRIPIVKAGWLIKCVEQGALLPYGSFQLNASVNSVRSTLTDPDFVANFFQSSRLHFIGSWKERFEKLLPGFREIPCRFDPVKAGSLRLVFHIDMDCFFASVAIRENPSLANLPVAVSHSTSAGSGEVSTSNYIARDFGVRSGMYLKTALKLCPNLKIVPYQFELYATASEQIYRIFYSITHSVQCVSLDEVFFEIPFDPESNSSRSLHSIEEALNLANSIRADIFRGTQCNASAGISNSILLSRMATKSAKPNGTFFLDPTRASEHIADLPIKDLPGVGWSGSKKIKELGIETCGQLQGFDVQVLLESFGEKRGRMLHNFASGIDTQPLTFEFERKTITVEVGWGVRFNTIEQVNVFLLDLCKELTSRISAASRLASNFSLKIKRKSDDAPMEPEKFLGHGMCDSFSKSANLSLPTADAEVIHNTVFEIFKTMGIPPQLVRAVGIAASKLSLTKEGQTHQTSLVDLWSKSSQIERKKPSPIRNSKSPKVLKSPKAKSFFEAPSLRSGEVSSSISVPEGVDPDFFGELPLHIQKELSHTHRSSFKKPMLSKTAPSPSKNAQTGAKKNARKIIQFKSRNLVPSPASFDQFDLPDISEIEQSVYEELPLDIQREILRNGRKKSKIISFFQPRKSNKLSQKSLKKSSDPREESKDPNEHLMSAKDLEDLLSESKWKAYLTVHLRTQIELDNLEQVQIFIRRLSRMPDRTTYIYAAAVVNSEMLTRYGGHLAP